LRSAQSETTGTTASNYIVAIGFDQMLVNQLIGLFLVVYWVC